MKKTIWIGYDPREQDAFNVAAQSIRRHLTDEIEIFAVVLPVLQSYGLYQRPTERRDGKLWDRISEAPMSTEFAISRFFIPWLAKHYVAEPSDWALFMDCDVMARADLNELFALADPDMALQCVQHDYQPAESVKMDGQVQTAYPRKNWSSVMLWNLNHPAHAALTIAKLNTWAGRALHGFRWLPDQFIGQLPAEWNHLVGVDQPRPDAKLVHFTLGTPSMDGYAACEHAGEWWRYCPPPMPRADLRTLHDFGDIPCPTGKPH